MRFPSKLIFGKKYQDDEFEYRNVILTKELYQKLPSHRRTLREEEWRNVIGISVKFNINIKYYFI